MRAQFDAFLRNKAEGDAGETHGEMAMGAEPDSGETIGWMLDLSYGISNWLTASLVIPFVHKRHHLEPGPMAPAGSTTLRTTTGPGDPLALLKFTIVGSEARAPSALKLGLVTGLTIPVGRNRPTDDVGSLPTGLQLGTGAVSLLAGGYFTKGVYKKVQLSGSVIYRHSLANRYGYALGEELALSLDTQILHLWPFTLAAGLRFGWRASDRDDGIDQMNSGGINLSAHLGAAYFVGQSLFFTLDAIAPFVQSLEGEQLTSRISLVAGVGFNL